ncbi:MAG: hypothetical protein ACJ0UT_11250 [Candidatus Latescibacterota bacterium]
MELLSFWQARFRSIDGTWRQSLYTGPRLRCRTTITPEIVPHESGGLICLEQLMGVEIWKQVQSNVSLALNQEGRDMYGTVGQELRCLDTENGKASWSRNPGGGVSGPSIAGKRLYTASSNPPFFTCFDIEGNKAEPLWQFKMDDCVGEPCPAIAGGVAFILCLDWNAYAFK